MIQGKSIGIFEAKTHFSQLCDMVAESGVSVVVQRRGKPLVNISPASVPDAKTREDIYSAWKAWMEGESPEGEEFPEVWRMRQDKRPPHFGEGE